MILALIAVGLIAVVGALAIVLGCGAIIINLLCRVPYAGTPPDQIDRILNAIAIKPGQRFYDLGCGDGRVAFAAARRGAIAIGYELQPLTYLRAKWTQWQRYPRAKIHWGNFHRAPIADADVVFIFLVGVVMPRVAAWLAERLRPGTTVVSYGFPLPGWKATTILQSPKPNGSHIYIYQTAGGKKI